MCIEKPLTESKFLEICRASVKLIVPQNRPPVNELDIWWGIREGLVDFFKAVPKSYPPESNTIKDCTVQIKSLIDKYERGISGEEALQIAENIIVEALTKK